MKNLSALRNMLLALSLLGVRAARAQVQTAKNPPAPDPLFQTVASLDTASWMPITDAILRSYARLFLTILSSITTRPDYPSASSASSGISRSTSAAKLRRDLVPGTLEVYPITGYREVEIG